MSSIDKKDFMHGAALVSLADSERFESLVKLGGKYGHYVVNGNRHFLIKYANNPLRQFTFSEHDVKVLRELSTEEFAYVVFVCNDEVVTALSYDELAAIYDVGTFNQAIYVHAKVGRQLRFKGELGIVGPIPRNRYPEVMLI